MRAPWFLLLWAAACTPSLDDTDAEPVGPLQQVDPTEVRFGTVPVGQEAPDIQVTIANPGDAPLDVYSIALTTEAPDFDLGTVGQGQRIRAGSAGTFVVRFFPQTTGPVATGVAITSNVTPEDAPLVLPVTADVVSAALETVPGSIAVDVATPSAVALELRNPGQAELEIAAINATGDPGFAVDLRVDRNGVLPFELAPTDPDTGRPAITIEVTWDPEASDGSRVGELVLQSNAWEQERLVVALSAAAG